MYCILVAGMPASGKSTLAEYLSKRINIPLFSKDTIKEKLYDTVGFQSRSEKVQLGIGAMDILYYSAEQLMKCNKPFILENNFEDISKEPLENIIREYLYTPIMVRIDGDTEVLYKRFVERDISPERHRGHVINTRYPEDVNNKEIYVPMGIDKFKKSIEERGWRRFMIGENIVQVDSTDYSKENKEEILNSVLGIIRNIDR